MVGRTALLLDHLVAFTVVEGVPLEELGAVEAAHEGVCVHALAGRRWHGGRTCHFWHRLVPLAGDLVIPLPALGFLGFFRDSDCGV